MILRVTALDRPIRMSRSTFLCDSYLAVKQTEDKTMKIKITLALLLMFTLAGIASAEDPGKGLFTAKCAICHGADGSGKTSIGKNLKIADFHSPDVKKQSNAELKTVITDGKNKMPAFKGKLTDAQIDQVIAYVRDLGK
jgi:mono/diheme cytochrome c family protein